MDLAKLLAFGDRYLDDNYYLVVEPLPLFLMLGILTAMPWAGARLWGRPGLVFAIGMAAVLIFAQFLWLDGSFNLADEEGTEALKTLGRRLAKLEAAVLSASSLVAVWFRCRAERRSPSRPDFEP